MSFILVPLPQGGRILSRGWMVAQQAMAKVGILRNNMVYVYFLSDPHHAAFKECLDLIRYKAYGKPSGDMVFKTVNGRLILKEIVARLPATNIPA